MEGHVPEGTPALQAHEYPLWVKFFAVCVVVATVYSLTFLPEYLVAARKMHAAEAAYQSGNYDESIQLYHALLEKVPTSKTARIGAAEAIFSNSDRSLDSIAMTYLTGISLDEKEWARILKVMPAGYEQYFETVKK